MSSSNEHLYTFNDYWNLPEGVRSDLINGQLYIRQTPYMIHAKLIGALMAKIYDYLDKFHPTYELLLGPLAVNPDGRKINWVEPDLFMTSDPNKITEQYFIGAPDWVIEVTSFDSRFTDYIRKSAVYYEAGVREYWIIDPEKEHTMVFCFEADAAPVIYRFDQVVPVGCLGQLTITIKDFLK